MPYDRFQWWVGRSKSSEYQLAYDRTVDIFDKHAPARLRGQGYRPRILDIGFGTGEILERFWRRYGNSVKLYGFDMEEQAFDHTLWRFRRKGIPAHSIPIEKGSKTQVRKAYGSRGITLFRETIITPIKTPPSYFDVVSMTFQDVQFGTIGAALAIDPRGVGNAQVFLDRRGLRHEIDSKAFENMRYLVKGDGLALLVLYDVFLSGYPDGIIPGTFEACFPYFDVLYQQYFADEKVNSDSVPIDEIPFESTGYRVVLFGPK